MKKLYLLLLCCLAATSCKKTDDPNANPLVFEKSELSIAQYTQTPMVAIANAPQDAKIVYQITNQDVASVDNNGMIVAKSVGQTFISAFVDGNRDATLSNTLTVKVTENVAKGIVLNYPQDKTTIQAGDKVTVLFTFDPATTSNHKVNVVSTDSMGTKYLEFEVKLTAKLNQPDTLIIAAKNAGEATFYLEKELSKDVKLKSKSVTVNVTPTAPAGTGLAIGRTPTQLRNNLLAPSTLKIGGTKRQILDTLAVDFLPDNFSAKPLKITFDEQEIIFATEITFEDKIGDKKVTRRGIAVTPAKAGWTTILITSADGYQIKHTISVSAADQVAPKFAAIKSIKFKQRNIEIPVLLNATLKEATPLPEVEITFKEANVSEADAQYTKSLLNVYTDWNYAPTKDTLPSNVIGGTNSDGKLVVSAQLGMSGHGYARCFANIADPNDGKVLAVDTCMVKVSGLPEGIVFKPTFDFANAKYTVNALINPVSYYYSDLQPGAKASLIYTKPGDAKAKPEVKETITLPLSNKGDYYVGSFTPFSHGARLDGYSVKYEFNIPSYNGSSVTYFYETKTIEVNTGTAFAPKL